MHGFVGLTGRELADQKRSRLSRGESTPLGKRGRAVLRGAIAAAVATLVVEVIALTARDQRDAVGLI